MHRNHPWLAWLPDYCLMTQPPHVICPVQEAITEDHWLRMRDTGSLDEEGFLALSGRCADAVKLQDEVSCDWRRAVT